MLFDVINRKVIIENWNFRKRKKNSRGRKTLQVLIKLFLQLKRIG